MKKNKSHNLIFFSRYPLSGYVMLDNKYCFLILQKVNIIFIFVGDIFMLQLVFIQLFKLKITQRLS